MDGETTGGRIALRSQFMGTTASPPIDRAHLLAIYGVITILVAAGLYLIIRHHGRMMRAHREILRSQQHAQEKSRVLELTLQNMAQGLVMVDANRKILIYNTEFARMLDIPADEMTRLFDFDEVTSYLIGRGAYGDLDNERCAGLFEQLIAPAGRIVPEYTELSRPDGTVLAIRTRPLADGGFVRTLTDVTEQRRTEKKIAHLARHDHLTNLANRTQFRERLDTGIAGLERGVGFSVLFIDLDNFKVANDTYGHSFGDRLLRCVSDRLRSAVRQSDIVARLGGDEFAVIINGLADRAALTARASHLVDLMRVPIFIDGRPVVATCSIGGSVAPFDTTCPDELLRNADLALYKAKSEGRNCFRAFDTEMAHSVIRRRELEGELHYALTRGELELHYQPLHAIPDGTVSGFEALIRWNHPDRGLVSPVDFIPIAEETGQIVAIGAWVIDQACKQAATWPADMRVAVNLSPAQFRDGGLVATVLGALNRHELAPHRLELEITESIVLETDESTLKKLEELREFGVRIAMDDFGTGYSALNYLRSIRFDTIKIDRSFVDGLTRDQDCEAIVHAIIRLAECLGASTTAEGVETSAQLAVLKELGCQEAQGYFFSRPCPQSTLGPMLEPGYARNGEAQGEADAA